MKTFVALSALVALTVAAPANPYRPAPYHPAPAPYHPAPAPYHPAPHHSGPSYHEEPAHYQYGYAVQDEYAGTSFRASEARDGYATNGEYSVLLPDGRTQTVTYTVDDYSGYVADVKYDGYAKEYQPAPYQPSHPAPYHPAPAPYHPAPYKPAYQPAPYHPAPYHANPYRPAPYHPAPAPYHPAPAPYHPAPHHSGPSYHEEPAHYQYGYAVQDEYAGTSFRASEARDGYATNGEYSVLLPDGRTQTVTYTVDDYSGYVADVKYDGYAKEYQPAPYQPSHPAPYHPAPAPYHPAPYKPAYQPAPYHPAPYHG
eukprot:maker-scaffold143_size313727-snap-gene-2.24 protein:Tk09426 transcript:maker-scaffold143_size313727-snap-gene-2.24-mRNA-1 annotation:"cuticle protein"